MKKFLQKFSLFVIFVTSSLLITTGVIFYTIRSMADFKINSDSRYVIFGHSHPECAFNDSVISNFKNLAQSGESYFYTYQKVKMVIQQNPQIEVVFIEFTNNQINNLNMSKWIWSEEFLSNKYHIYSPFMNLKDHFLIIQNNLSGFINSFSLSLRYNFGKIRNSNYSFNNQLIWGYRQLNECYIDSLLCSNTTYNLPAESNYRISEENISYLQQALQFCKLNKKRVFLIRSPQHTKSQDLINNHIYNKILQTRFSSIQFLDFNEFPLENDEFMDFEHLNSKGAAKFSKWFDTFLKNNLTPPSQILEQPINYCLY